MMNDEDIDDWWWVVMGIVVTLAVAAWAWWVMR